MTNSTTMSPSASPTFIPHEKLIRRRYVQIPSDQKKLLDNGDSAWLENLRDGQHGMLNVPSGVLQDLKDFHVRKIARLSRKESTALQEAPSVTRAPESTAPSTPKTSQPNSDRNAPPAVLSLPQRQRQGKQRSSQQHDMVSSPPAHQERDFKKTSTTDVVESDNSSAVSWSQSVYNGSTQQPRSQEELHVPAMRDFQPSSSDHIHTSPQQFRSQEKVHLPAVDDLQQPSSPIKRIREVGFMNNLQSSGNTADDGLEIEAPAALDRQIDSVNRAASRPLQSVLHPTPPSAQVETIPCSFNEEGSSIEKPPAPKRTRRMKTINAGSKDMWKALTLSDVTSRPQPPLFNNNNWTSSTTTGSTPSFAKKGHADLLEKPESARQASRQDSSLESGTSETSQSYGPSRTAAFITRSLAPKRHSVSNHVNASAMTIGSTPSFAKDQVETTHAPQVSQSGGPFTSQDQGNKRKRADSLLRAAVTTTSTAYNDHRTPVPGQAQREHMETAAQNSPSAKDALEHSAREDSCSPQTPYAIFKAMYPDYRGGIRDFVAACLNIQQLKRRRALPAFLYDDFIRVYSTGYCPYISVLYEIGHPVGKPLTAIQWYNENITSIQYNKGVIKNENLDAILKDHEKDVEAVLAVQESQSPDSPQSGTSSELVEEPEVVENKDQDMTEAPKELSTGEPKDDRERSSPELYLASPERVMVGAHEEPAEEPKKIARRSPEIHLKSPEVIKVVEGPGDRSEEESDQEMEVAATLTKTATTKSTTVSRTHSSVNGKSVNAPQTGLDKVVQPPLANTKLEVKSIAGPSRPSLATSVIRGPCASPPSSLVDRAFGPAARSRETEESRRKRLKAIMERRKLVKQNSGSPSSSVAATASKKGAR